MIHIIQFHGTPLGESQCMAVTGPGWFSGEFKCTMDIEKCVGVHPLRRRQGYCRQRQQWEKLCADLNQHDMFGGTSKQFLGFYRVSGGSV